MSNILLDYIEYDLLKKGRMLEIMVDIVVGVKGKPRIFFLEGVWNAGHITLLSIYIIERSFLHAK